MEWFKVFNTQVVVGKLLIAYHVPLFNTMVDKYCSDVGDVVSRSLTVTFDFMCLHRNLTAKTLVTVKDIHVGRYRLKQPLSKTDQPRFGELLRNGTMWQLFPNMCYKRGR